MRTLLLLGFAAAALLSAARCFADSPGAVSGELAFDARAYAPLSGPTRSDLTFASARVEAPLAPDLRAEVYGVRYDDVNRVQEAVLEKDTGSGRLRVGLVRLPFGIHDTRETYDSGLIDYPIARNDYESHGVDWGVPGALWIGGSPRLQVEAAAFSGLASGIENNRNPVGGGAARLQTYSGDLILGLSRWDGYLSDTSSLADREVVQMNGVDWRYTRPHLLIRGEYLTGVIGDDRPHGWYSDLYYRLPGVEKCTLVGRIEESHPAADTASRRQVTVGARYVLAPDWTAAVNWKRKSGGETDEYDGAATNTVVLQVYHKVEF
jgi:hypothetical protein